MRADYGRGLYKDYELLLTKNEAIVADYKLLQKNHQILEHELGYEKAREEKLHRALCEKNSENAALKKEILRLNGLLNADGKNSGIPTSKTPLSKKKVIPNSREKSGKKIGGQPGHPKRNLKAFADDAITETVEHKPSGCPDCGGAVVETEKSIQRDELDYDVVVIKRRHRFISCKCEACGKIIRTPIPTELKEENQYGKRVKALGVALMTVGNVSVEKTRKMLYGLSEEGINPTEGFLIKQQRKAAKALEPFIESLKARCRSLKTLYWDDTVVSIHAQRGCLRFYGDEQLALYCAHRYKNKAGLDADGILTLLPKETTVMHDHNRVNYNQTYSFSNIECNVHLLRDLQKTTDHLQHQWSAELKALLTKTNVDRNAALLRGEDTFEDAYITTFFKTFNRIMLHAAEENQKDSQRYYVKDERALILRILDYKDNYLAWVVNFELPFSNNLSERALRGIKSKMKISGQFQSEETAQHYAAIKSYIETCARNGINEMAALLRLFEGKPYTVAEILAH